MLRTDGKRLVGSTCAGVGSSQQRRTRGETER